MIPWFLNNRIFYALRAWWYDERLCPACHRHTMGVGRRVCIPCGRRRRLAQVIVPIGPGSVLVLGRPDNEHGCPTHCSSEGPHHDNCAWRNGWGTRWMT